MQHSEISFRPAGETDARIISGLRQRIWSTTYRGIYPDDLIDDFDYVWHIVKDINRIRSDNYIVFLIVGGDIPIGYLILRKADPFILQSLYVLLKFQKKASAGKHFSLSVLTAWIMDSIPSPAIVTRITQQLLAFTMLWVEL